jgi:acetylornithine/succinyldiaminopimelate/putrescine aminotransferase
MGAFLTVEKISARFQPLLSDVKTADYNFFLLIRKTINENTAGVFIECIQEKRD